MTKFGKIIVDAECIFDFISSANTVDDIAWIQYFYNEYTYLQNKRVFFRYSSERVKSNWEPDLKKKNDK